MILNQVKTEQVVVASVMEEPRYLPSNIITALCSWHYWECVEASKIAQTIISIYTCGNIPSRPFVRARMDPQYRDWVDHSNFKDSLPLAMAEHEAFDLLPLYRNKRTIELVGRYYQQMIDHPEQAHTLATRLREELGGL